MTWIETVPAAEADHELLDALQKMRALYPIEYAAPADPGEKDLAGIVGSHTLLPQTLFHAFATFGTLMSPELALTRRQHEMITTLVSVTNRCVY